MNIYYIYYICNSRQLEYCTCFQNPKVSVEYFDDFSFFGFQNCGKRISVAEGSIKFQHFWAHGTISHFGFLNNNETEIKHWDFNFMSVIFLCLVERWIFNIRWTYKNDVFKTNLTGELNSVDAPCQRCDELDFLRFVEQDRVHVKQRVDGVGRFDRSNRCLADQNKNLLLCDNFTLINITIQRST